MIAHNKEKINTDLAAKAKPFTMIMSSGKDRLWPNSFGDVGKSSFGAGPKKKPDLWAQGHKDTLRKNT